MVKKKKKGKKGSLLRILVKKNVKKPKIKKAVKKVRKKATRKKKAEEEKFDVGFEEVIIKCPSCGREFKVVKSSGFSMEGMLCQRCAAGGGIGFEGEGEF